MPERRTIHTRIWEDDFFGTLLDREQLIWIGLFSRLADDQGRLHDNPTLILAKIFPYKIKEIEIDEIERALAKFSDQGKIIRYQADGKRLIQIVNWWEHQTPQWAQPSNQPAPAGWQDAIRTRINGHYIEDNWHAGGLQPQIEPITDWPFADSHEPPTEQQPELSPEPLYEPPFEFSPETSPETSPERSLELQPGPGPGPGPIKKMPKKDPDRPKNGRSEPAEPATATDPKLQLRLDQTKPGQILMQQFTIARKDRTPIRYYANSQQRDGYLKVYKQIGDELEPLVIKGLERNRQSLASMLAWLQGCAKKRHPPDQADKAKREAMAKETLDQLYKLGWEGPPS